MSQIKDKCSELSSFIFDLKDKLSDQEYKFMLDTCKEIFDLSAKTSQNQVRQTLDPIETQVCNCENTFISRCYFYNRCRVKQLVERQNLQIVSALYTAKNLHPLDQPYFYIDEPFENISINFQYKISIQLNPVTTNQTIEADERFFFIIKNLFKLCENSSFSKLLIFLEIYNVLFKNFHLVKKTESLAKTSLYKLNEMLTNFQDQRFIETRCNFNILDILNGWKQHLDSVIYQYQVKNQERTSSLQVIGEVLARYNSENSEPCTYKFRSGYKKGQRCLERGCKSHPSAN
jgi:hypothetical protein